MLLQTVRNKLAALPWRLIRDVVAIAVVAAVIALGIYTWRNRPEPLTQQAYTALPPERQVADVPRVTVPVAAVQAYDKTKLVKQLPAMAHELAPANRQAIANARIPATRGGASAVAVLDTTSGESRIVVKEIPPPLVEFEGDGALGLRYGINSDLAKEGTLYGRLNILRVGNVHLGAYAELNTDAEAKAQASIEYRW